VVAAVYNCGVAEVEVLVWNADKINCLAAIDDTRNLPRHRALPTPPEKISLDQFQLCILVSFYSGFTRLWGWWGSAVAMVEISHVACGWLILSRDNRMVDQGRSLTLFPKLNLYPSSSNFRVHRKVWEKERRKRNKKYLRSGWSTESA